MKKKITCAIVSVTLLSVLLAGCSGDVTPSASATKTSDSLAPSASRSVSPAAPSPSSTAGLEEPAALESMIKRARLSNTRIKEGDWYDKINTNIQYMESLDVLRFLYYYYETSGVPMPDGLKPYDGCEKGNQATWHGGMAMGHVLSTCSMLYASTGERQWLDKANLMIDELEKCQLENGYLFSKPETLFDNLENQNGETGVLYYYIHKVFAGLIDAYTYCNNEKALAIAEKLSDWVYGRMSVLTDAQRSAVLKTEYGGMNEAFYNLYAITNKDRDKKNAEFFNETIYLDNWAKNLDNLNMKHANTTVPKAVGYARGYMLTGDTKLLSAAQNFWTMTAEGRTFSTGAMSEREIMGTYGATSAQIYDSPGETCVSYNMLKLSQYLYEITGAPKYMNYIERVLLNSIMGSINEEGGKTYYQWLDTDARKLFGKPYTTFWCCVDTGMESFSKVLEACYHTENSGTLQINIFISSSYVSDEVIFTLTNSDEHNKIVIDKGSSGAYTIKLRVPYWADSVNVKVNGETVAANAEDGYIILNREWKKDDVIEYDTVYKAYTESTLDNTDLFSIKYGPYVLAATGKRYELGNKLPGSFSSGYLADLTSSISRKDNGYVLDTPQFSVDMQKYGLIVNETYTVYFNRVDSISESELKPDIAMRATLTASRKTREFLDNVSYEREFYPTWTTGRASYLDCIHDGKVPGTSKGLAVGKTMNSQFVLYEAFFGMTAGERWLNYQFDKSYNVSGVSVFWASNNAAAPNNVKFPDSYKIQYYNGSQWLDVSNPSGYTVNDGWNHVTFDPVSASQLRLLVSSSSPWGIYEWSVKYD